MIVSIIWHSANGFTSLNIEKPICSIVFTVLYLFHSHSNYKVLECDEVLYCNYIDLYDAIQSSLRSQPRRYLDSQSFTTPFELYF